MQQQTQAQGQQSTASQRRKRRRLSRKSIIIVIFLVATIIILLSILSAMGFIPAIWATALSIVVAALSCVFTLLPLIPVDDKPEQPAGSSVPQTPAVPTQMPQIIINVPPSQPSPPAPQSSSPPAELSSYRRISSTPPPTDPKTIQQRENVVKEVYAKLPQSDITAVVLTGIGGVGKSTLAALVYKYAEEQRRAGKGLFKTDALWFRVDENTTFLDLAGNIFDALGKPLLDFAHLAPQSQALALFNALNTVDVSRLVVLDQFENLLNWETGQALTNRPGVGEFLDALNSQSCMCRILLTSRPQPKGTRPQPPSHMQSYPVGGLEIAEGIALLRSRGVTGTDTELGTAVKRCGGHGLSLELLAILVNEQKLNLSALLKNTQLWDGDIATNLLNDIYTKQLSDTQRKLLQAFSVYREAVPLDAAKVIVENATEVQLFSTVRGLLAQSLMQAVGEGRYQPHPIVANYAQYHFIQDNDEANRQAGQAAHTRAAQYYLQQAAKTCLPRDKRQRVSDVQPLVEAGRQLCQAEHQKEAYDLMVRESLFADLRRWGGNVILLELCQLLLPEHWQPEPSQGATIYSNIAAVYNALGQKQEALKYYEQALRIFGEVGGRGGEGTTLHNIGTIYFEQDHNISSFA